MANTEEEFGSPLVPFLRNQSLTKVIISGTFHERLIRPKKRFSDGPSRIFIFINTNERIWYLKSGLQGVREGDAWISKISSNSIKGYTYQVVVFMKREVPGRTYAYHATI